MASRYPATDARPRRETSRTSPMARDESPTDFPRFPANGAHRATSLRERDPIFPTGQRAAGTTRQGEGNRRNPTLQAGCPDIVIRTRLAPSEMIGRKRAGQRRIDNPAQWPRQDAVRNRSIVARRRPAEGNRMKMMHRSLAMLIGHHPGIFALHCADEPSRRQAGLLDHVAPLEFCAGRSKIGHHPLHLPLDRLRQPTHFRNDRRRSPTIAGRSRPIAWGTNPNCRAERWQERRTQRRSCPIPHTEKARSRRLAAQYPDRRSCCRYRRPDRHSSLRRISHHEVKEISNYNYLYGQIESFHDAIMKRAWVPPFWIWLLANHQIGRVAPDR